MQDNKSMHDAADRSKANLDHNVASHVARGDEATPPEKGDPFATRKAMFKKADSIRGGIDTTGENVDPAIIAQMEAEARGEVLNPNDRVTQPLNQGKDSALQTDSDFVTISVEGGQPLHVAKRDVDREGGQVNYMRRRQLDEEQAALARDKAETQMLRDQLRESQRAIPARQDDAAHGAGLPPAQSRNGFGETGAELAEKAARLAKQIYSGDVGDAEKAILELLTTSSARGETLTEAQIRDRVDAGSQQAAQQQTHVVNPANARVEAINASINNMAISEYPDICSDAVAQPATFAKFKQMVQDPANKDRRAVDVARDACEWGRRTFMGNPRERIVQDKRGLPSPATASSVANELSDDERPAMSPSDVIAQMRDRRDFGRRTK